MLNQKVKEMAIYLIKKLSRKHIVIQYYKKNENTIYLKLDYGVLGTIRISDVKEAKPFNHKYNLVTFIVKPYVKHVPSDYGVILRYFYPFNHADMLIKQILDDRRKKSFQYGLINYKLYMNKNKSVLETQEPYWKQVI